MSFIVGAIFITIMLISGWLMLALMMDWQCPLHIRNKHTDCGEWKLDGFWAGDVVDE